MKVLHTFKKKIVIHLDYDESDIATSALNMFYVGEPNCNHLVDGKLVAKYPEIEKSVPAFRESHYNCRRSQIVIIEVELMENGTIRIKN